jgi:NAD(P)-dependent dehydrogenase (short-subunit alcohol dehydrogenase family)
MIIATTISWSFLVTVHGRRRSGSAPVRVDRLSSLVVDDTHTAEVDMGLDHAKTAVVTGAGSGIGRAITLRLGRDGYRVGVVDIDGEAAGCTVAELERLGCEGEAFTCDVADYDMVLAMADHFFDEFGEVGLLFNNAGIGGGGYVGETSIEDWRKVIGINLMGVVHGCTAFLPRMKEAGRGHVINTASIAGLYPVMGYAPYNSSKAAVVSLSETMTVELAPYNIGVTVLCPTIVPTNIMENSLKVVCVDGYEGTEWGMDLINSGMVSSKITADDVARVVLEAVAKDRLFVVTNLMAKLNWTNVRLMTATYFRLMAWLHKKGIAQPVLSFFAKRGLA